MKKLTKSRSEETDDNALRRVQLDLPPRAFERLKQLKTETEASTYAEVIKNALKIYASAVDFQKDGGKFLVQAKDGAIAPLILFG